MVVYGDEVAAKNKWGRVKRGRYICQRGMGGRRGGVQGESMYHTTRHGMLQRCG